LSRGTNAPADFILRAVARGFNRPAFGQPPPRFGEGAGGGVRSQFLSEPSRLVKCGAGPAAQVAPCAGRRTWRRLLPSAPPPAGPCPPSDRSHRGLAAAAGDRPAG